jgi:hypothetical protein
MVYCSWFIVDGYLTRNNKQQTTNNKQQTTNKRKNEKKSGKEKTTFTRSKVQ